MTEKMLLKVEEAAERLGMSRKQVFRLIAEKRIRSVKIGKLRRISPRALEEFIERAEAEESPVDG